MHTDIAVSAKDLETCLRSNYEGFLNQIKREKEDAENGISGFLRFDEDIQDLPTSLSFVYSDIEEKQLFPLVFEEMKKLLGFIREVLGDSEDKGDGFNEDLRATNFSIEERKDTMDIKIEESNRDKEHYEIPVSIN